MIEKVPSYKNTDQYLPFQTSDWSRIWYETLGFGWEPYTLAVNGTIFAPFARKDSLVIFSGGENISDYQDIAGPDAQKSGAWAEIIPFLKNDGITTIRLNNVPENSPTIEYFRARQASVEQEDTTPIMPLPETWDAYLQNLTKKDRHELARKIRKFEREHTNISITNTVDVEVLLSLMKLDPRKKEFLSPDMQEFFRKISDAFKDQIRLTVLAVDGHPAAATLEFITDKTVMLYNSGIDEEHFSGAGFYLKAMNINHAIKEGLAEYNFLQGNERYKYQLGGKDFFVYTISTNINI